MSDTSRCSGRSTKSTSAQMQGLLNEFKLLYQNRLKKLELQEPHNEETIKIKIKTLESYIKDLLEQNDVLIQTIDELEKEANSRMTKLEAKLSKSTNQQKDQSYKMKDLEKDLKSLNCRNESLERELKSKNEQVQLLERETSRLKCSYEEAVKTLASKTRCDESILLNMSSHQNEAHLKNLEDSLSTAVRSKNELCFELKEQDKKIVSLHHYISELQHILYEKDDEIKGLEENLNSKIASLKKIEYPSQNECKIHRDFMQVELEKEDMKLKQANLNHDVSCLISAFQNAKSSGKFELKNLFLKEISLERLNGLVGDDNTKRVHFADLNAQNSHDLLKAELHHSEEIIASLKQELNSLRNQYESLLNGKEIALSTIKSTLSTVHNKEIITSGQIFDKDMEIRKFKNEIHELKNLLDICTEENNLKKKEVKECKLELTDFVNEVKNLRSEMMSKDQQIFGLKEKLHEQSLEFSSKIHNYRDLSPSKKKTGLSSEEISQYEKRIQELKSSLEDAQKERYKLVDELNQQESRYKSNIGSSQVGFESLRFELKTRDDIIQKLRKEVLILQEKRDQIYADLDAATAKYSQIECRLFFKEEENGHLNNRFSQCQKEIQDWKKSYEEEHIKNETNISKFNMYEETLRGLKDKITETQEQNHRLTQSLQNLQFGSKETRDKLSEELAKRQEEILNLQHERSNDVTSIQQQLNEKISHIQKLTAELETKTEQMSRQEDKLSQVSSEVTLFKRKCDEQEKELCKFRNQLSETQINSNSHLTSITGQLIEREDLIAKLQDETSRRLMAIEQLEKELVTLQTRHDSAIKEIGCLESRLQSHHYDSKNEAEMLKVEIQKRDDAFYQLKHEKDSYNGQIISLEDKLKDYELIISNLKQQNVSYQCSFKTKDELIYKLENQIDDHKSKLKRVNEDLARAEEKNNLKSYDFTNMTELKKELEHKIESKNSTIAHLRDQLKSHEEKMDDLRKKLIQKEDSIQKLSMELDRLKTISQTKSKECFQKDELTQNLELSLHRAESELDNLKRLLDQERSKSSLEIQNLETELDGAKSLTCNLSDNITQIKYELEQFKGDNLLLTSKLQSYGEDKNSLIDKNQHLEVQLVSSMEKNKLCQQEVAARDQKIINLTSDLNLVQEKYSSSSQELKIQQEEIERLNSRIKTQSYELKEISAMNDHMEMKQSSLEQHLNQRDYEIEVYKQDLMKQDKQIENIKSEWTSNIRNHEEEVRGFKQNFQILNEELSHTKSELSDFMNKINTLKSQVAELNTGLDSKHDENYRLTQTIRKYEQICNEQEKKISQYLQDISMEKNHNDKANSQIENLYTKINEYDHREELSQKNRQRQDETLKTQQETLMELKFKNVEMDEALEKQVSECTNLKKLLDEKNSEIKKLVGKVQDLNEIEDKLNFEISKLESSLSQSESTSNQNYTKLTEKIDEVNELDAQLEQSKSDYKTYQQKYQYTAEDIAARDNRLTQMEYEFEETLNHSQILKQQNQELLNANNAAKNDFDNLVEQKRNSDKEITRLESTISELQMSFTSTHQQLKMEIARLEAHAINLNTQLEQSEKQIESLTNQIDVSNDNTRKLENQISNLSHEIVSKTDEIERVQANMKVTKEANIELERANREKENMISEQASEREHMKNEVNDARHQLQHCLNEKAHIEERFMLISKNLEQIQEEIRQKVTDYVRVEQLSQKQQTEIKTLKDRTRSYEEEMNETKDFADKLKKDLFATKEELINTQQDSAKVKSHLIKVQHELDSSKDQEKIITEQLVHNDNLLQQVHTEIRNERNKLQEAQRSISQLKQNLVDVTNEKESNENHVKNLTNKVKERELKLKSYQEELDTTQQSLRTCKEEMAEKEGHVKVFKMNLESAEKQRNHFVEEIQKYEEAVSQFKTVIENSQAKYRDSHSELLKSQQQIHDLKITISTVECQNKETVNIVGEKSKENAYLKNELANLRKSNDNYSNQTSQLEEKLNLIKVEFKKCQDESLAKQHQLKDFEQETYDLKQQLQAVTDKQKELMQEILSKDEQILKIRIEMQSINEKYNFKAEEVNKSQAEIQNLTKKCTFMYEEQKKLELSLDQSKENGERLHKESEMVISNVNSWVLEQRNNSEKLAIKIREQATAMLYLNAEKEKFIQEINNLQQHIKKLTADNESSAYDKEKIKALQNHLSQQQALLHELQSRLKEYENKIYTDNNEGTKVVEELQNRLRTNIESIQILNHQVNTLQRENLLTKETLEKERAARQTLQLQLESKNQFINSYTTPSPKKYGQSKMKSNRNEKNPQTANDSEEDSPDDIGYLSSPSRSSSNLRAPLRDKNNNLTDGSDFNADSDYWKHKAGELSMQLEQTKKFWSNRVDNLQNHVK